MSPAVIDAVVGGGIDNTASGFRSAILVPPKLPVRWKPLGPKEYQDHHGHPESRRSVVTEDRVEFNVLAHTIVKSVFLLRTTMLEYESLYTNIHCRRLR
jgi:hypothetical protein